jgi:hypothetical protein
MRIRRQWAGHTKRPMCFQALTDVLSLQLTAFRSSHFLLFCFCSAVGFFLCSCVNQRQYRTQYEPSPYSSKLTNAPNADIEVAANYTVGYVELDDQGWLFNRKQIDAVTSEFSEEAKTNGLLMVVFVHGWKHNASSEDDNVIMFHKHILERLAVMENFISTNESRPPRRVVGVYVGWRGLSDSIPYLNNVSFWNRKNVAERVGHGAVIELFSQLEDLRNQSNQQNRDAISNHHRSLTKLLILGHSFGGDIVFSATAPVLIERMVQNHEGTNSIPPKGIGDLVVLINPAFEAARFETLQRLATTKQFPAGTNCTLAIFTSTHDDATGIAFPAGRSISALFQTHENGEQRRANIAAVGHYNPYINYTLKVTSPEANLKRLSSTNTDRLAPSSVQTVLNLKQKIKNNSKKRRLTTSDVAYTFTHCELLPTTNCVPTSPIFNVAVDPNMIPDHGTIDRGVFVRFLDEFLSTFSDDSPD